MNKKILILDDRNEVKIVIRLLQSAGFEVQQVYDIASALDLYQQFDLIICDVDLCNENGFDFFDKIKDSYNGKFIFNSGCDYSEEAEKRGVPFCLKSHTDYVEIVEEIFSN